MAYFGRWPEWIEFFMESCKSNADIDWVIFSDCGIPKNRPSNVRVVDITFHEYIRAVEIALDIKMVNPHPYKICDIRPAFGIIHADYVTGYDFFGYGDLDVIYGRIRDFYHEDILLTYDALSTHPERASGHFFVMKNTPAMARAFQKIPGWQDLLSQQAYIAFDEIHFTQAIRALCSSHSGPRALFVERYSSPGPAARDEMVLEERDFVERILLFLWRAGASWVFIPSLVGLAFQINSINTTTIYNRARARPGRGSRTSCSWTGEGPKPKDLQSSPRGITPLRNTEQCRRRRRFGGRGIVCDSGVPGNGLCWREPGLYCGLLVLFSGSRQSPGVIRHGPARAAFS